MFLSYKAAVALCTLVPVVLALGTWGLILMRHRRRLALGVAGCALSLLAILSLPVSAVFLQRGLESTYPAISEAECPHADAVVVLGGALRARSAADPVAQLGAASDRVWVAARLIKAGCAPLIIVSAGGVRSPAHPWPEAEGIRAFLLDLGVAPTRIVSESQSRTTQENAVETARILHARGMHRILLVTSAVHLPRAVIAFRRVGFDVLPVPADRSDPSPDFAWLPSSEALAASDKALHEWCGLALVKLRGALS